MKQIRLKKCPFCGGKASFKKERIWLEDGISIRCEKCHTKTKIVLIDHPAFSAKCNGLDESTRYTEEQAMEVVAKIWNERKHT
ncbi:MAG: Lar family restriction alleviation protein [Oscillospiraceae bacterium]|nr:Lar family restriction alleviation protein [Oscillospiraceae bacterium]MBR3953672.1 Lar family restriction alleviation protein [Oscillospiraceae bacterium]